MKLVPYVFFTLLLPVLSCSDPGGTEDGFIPARHLLLITVDTLRADHVGCYGGRKNVSPTIDTLARDGVMFENAFAPMGMTLSSTCAIMTSRYPDETGVLDNTMQMNETEHTLAERLAEAGFRCRGLVANGVLRPNKSGIDQGFEFFRRIEQEGQLTFKAKEILTEWFGKDRREFLWLHYMDPHQPYDPRKPYAHQFDPDYEGNITTAAETLDSIFVQKIKMPERDIEHIKAIYDSQIRYVDDMIRRVMAALEKSGVADDTLVVFTADHGDDIYDHNCYFYHANSIYRSTTQVPLIFRYARQLPKGRRVPDMVELVDVMPTILATLGFDPEAGNIVTRPRGTDLRPAMEGGSIGKSLAFAQVKNKAYAVRNREWMLVDNPEGFMPKSVPEEGKYPIGKQELYRLTDDPREQKNVFGQFPEIENKMKQALDAWKSKLIRGKPRRQDLTDAEWEELRQLGYIENEEPEEEEDEKSSGG